MGGETAAAAGGGGNSLGDFTGAMKDIFGSTQTTKGSVEGSENVLMEILSTLVKTAQEEQTQTQQETAKTESTTDQNQKQSLDLVNEGALGELVGTLQKALEGTIQTGEDTTGAINASVEGVLKEYMPSINSAISQSGAYDSTTAKMLQENIVVKAAQAGQQTALDAASSTSNAATQLANVLAQVAGTQTGSSTATSGTESTSSIMDMLSEALNLSTQTTTEESTQESTKDYESSTTQKNKDSGLLGGLF